MRPASPWAVRYSIRTRSGQIYGTVTVALDRVPRGSSPLEVAKRTLAIRCPGTTPILPRAVRLDPAPGPSLELEAAAA